MIAQKIIYKKNPTLPIPTFIYITPLFKVILSENYLWNSNSDAKSSFLFFIKLFLGAELSHGAELMEKILVPNCHRAMRTEIRFQGNEFGKWTKNKTESRASEPGVDAIADCGLRVAEIAAFFGLRIADEKCWLRIADCGLRMKKIRLRPALFGIRFSW